MNEQEMFVRSEQTIAAVIDHIRDDQWELVTPEWVQAHRGPWTLRELIGYHAYDSAWVPDTLSGRTIEEVGDAHDAVRTAADPRAAYREQSRRAIEAARALDDPERIVHLSYGDWPAREYLKHTSSFRGFRAYDLARWLGFSTELPPDLVEAMWQHLAPEADQWRKLRVYGPAVDIAEDAPLQDRLLAMSGRDPRATVGA